MDTECEQALRHVLATQPPDTHGLQGVGRHANTSVAHSRDCAIIRQVAAIGLPFRPLWLPAFQGGHGCAPVPPSGCRTLRD